MQHLTCKTCLPIRSDEASPTSACPQAANVLWPAVLRLDILHRHGDAARHKLCQPFGTQLWARNRVQLGSSLSLQHSKCLWRTLMNEAIVSTWLSSKRCMGRYDNSDT